MFWNGVGSGDGWSFVEMWMCVIIVVWFGHDFVLLFFFPAEDLLFLGGFVATLNDHGSG